jgi:ring-1,2-phenylacetyl-CoA epoxidase subunit PaaB
MSTTDNQLPLWEVFIQSKSGTPHKHAGSIHASDKNMALENARDIYTRRGEGRNIWVVLSDQIAASKTEDEAEFFDPADDKVYRHPTFYKVPDGVKNM